MKLAKHPLHVAKQLFLECLCLATGMSVQNAQSLLLDSTALSTEFVLLMPLGQQQTRKIVDSSNGLFQLVPHDDMTLVSLSMDSTVVQDWLRTPLLGADLFDYRNKSKLDIKFVLDPTRLSPSGLLPICVVAKTLARVWALLGNEVALSARLSDLMDDSVGFVSAGDHLQTERTLRSPIRESIDTDRLREVRDLMSDAWDGLLSDAYIRGLADVEMRFGTDCYSYKDLLTTSYDCVRKLKGVVLNDIPCLRWSKGLLQLFKYNSSLFRGGHALSLIFAEAPANSHVWITPGSEEWIALSELGASLSDKVVIAPVECDDTFPNITAGSNHDIVLSSLYIRSSKSHFEILAACRIGKAPITRDSADRGFEQLCDVLQTSIQLQNDTDYRSNYGVIGRRDSDLLLRHLLHLPHIVDSALKANDLSMLVAYVIDASAQYSQLLKAATDRNPSVSDDESTANVNNAWLAHVRFVLDLLGFEVHGA